MPRLSVIDPHAGASKLPKEVVIRLGGVSLVGVRALPVAGPRDRLPNTRGYSQPAPSEKQVVPSDLIVEDGNQPRTIESAELSP
jgi:hypothetical protein